MTGNPFLPSYNLLWLEEGTVANLEMLACEFQRQQNPAFTLGVCGLRWSDHLRIYFPLFEETLVKLPL